MLPPEPLRFVAVTPVGVRHWLAQPARSPERDVVECLLWLGDQRPADLRAMSVSLSCSLSELARVLFVLNRSQAIEVTTAPPVSPASGPEGLAGLDADLQALAGPGQCAVLATDEGLCLGASGWGQVQADRLAAELVIETLAGPSLKRGTPPASWWFAHRGLLLCFSAGVDSSHPAWVRLARRLLLACGALGPVREGVDAAR